MRVLTAWRVGDRARLEQEFARAEELCASPATSALDAERRELLGSIVRRLRSGQEGAAVLGLLEHLGRGALCA